MLKPLFTRQRGFTLMELLAVIAILTVLSALVAGAITGVGASGQNARLEGDANTIGKAADRFRNEAFPQRYPVASCCAATDATPQDLLKAGDLGVRLIDFEAVLPGSPNKTFTPSFLKEVPNTAGLVSWRIDTRNGDVFFAQDGTQLVRPSTNRLDVSAATPSAGSVSDYTLELRMKKNEAALEVLEVAVPAGYSVGSFGPGILVGTLTGTFSTDNPWSPGQVLPISGTLRATSDSNKWALQVDYPDAVVNAPKALARADRTHQVTVSAPSQQAAGGLTLKLDTTGDAAHNQATETWELTIYGQVAVGATAVKVITNPVSLGVYRWLARQHMSIDVADFFQRVDGNQAVVLKGNSVPVAVAQNVTTPEDTPTPITLMGSDPEGDPLTFSVVAQPSHGTLSGVAPNLVYTPALNFHGADSFTFKVDDGMVASRAARVDITVSTNAVSITVTPVNDPPVALAQSVTTPEDTPKAVTLAGFDVDGDALTFAVVSPPSHGALGGTPPHLVYTPALNYHGPDGFIYTASDGVLASPSAVVSITVTPVNDPPVAGNDAYTTNANTSLTVAALGVLVNDTDVEGDALTALLVGGPSSGSLTLSANGSFTYTPNANFGGPVSFTYRAQDPSGARSNVATVSILVVPIVSTTSIRPGFSSNAFPPNDDGSTGAGIGFPVNFFGRNYSSLFINNNGNLTFNGSMGTYTPFGLTATGQAIIAPFFADVDTRVGNVVRYGTGTVDGRPSFGVNWPGVGCYSQNITVLNDFQVVLIDRSDISAGNFDIEFNYNRIQWETGQASGGNSVCQGGSAARIGFSNGTHIPGTFFELPGSGVPGSFLDSNPATGLIHSSLNTPQRGRYVFPVR